jgi:hypothetical protein
VTGKSDQLVDRGADGLQQLADKAAASGGLVSKLAEPLAEDAQFVRKLKPSLIAARVRGELPTNERPTPGRVAPPAPRSPKSPGGPNPWVIAFAALAAGIVLAKWLDWRGHAHPRD